MQMNPSLDAPSLKERFSARLTDVSELVKARLTTLVLMTTAAGFALGKSAGTSWWLLLYVLIGTGLVAGGAAVLNQLLEIDRDRRMERTKDRPLPALRMTQENALFFGALISGLGIAFLVITTNYFAGLIAAITLFVYLFVYTPMKRVSSLNTIFGAIPGALPPVIGCVAATGSVTLLCWELFAIQFLWQMPHFYSIGWLCRDDYVRGGYRMLAIGDPSGKKSAAHSLVYALVLIPVAVAPLGLGLAGWLYAAVAFLASGFYAYAAFAFLQAPDRRTARKLFFYSLLYLPIVLGALIIDAR
jgi:protoheme IX farnesyltransferase